MLVPLPFRRLPHRDPDGPRLKFPDAVRSARDDGHRVDFTHAHPADGFSMIGPIVVYVPEPLDAGALPLDDAAASTSDASPVLVIEAATGTRVAHFAELDPFDPDEGPQVLAFHPLAPLGEATRYIVALRGLRRVDGEAVAPPSTFRRLRDGDGEVPTGLREHYEGRIFTTLEAMGIARADLILAWDFTTGTRAFVTRDMLDVRNTVIACLDAEPPAVSVTEVRDDVDDEIGRQIEGTVEAPFFLDSTEPGGRLRRDDAGRVVDEGRTEVPFTLIVPRAVTEAGPGAPPARIVQFGHGFFGGRDELDKPFVRRFAQQMGAIVVAIDWWGMSRVDGGHLRSRCSARSISTVAPSPPIRRARCAMWRL